MNQQEYLLKLQLLEQQANHFEEQLNLINSQIEELGKLKLNFSSLEKSGSAESFVEFSKGIFVKSKIEKKEFLVDVGANILVPKTIKEIDEIIESQIEKFENIKPEIEDNINHINAELDTIFNQVQKGEVESETSGQESQKPKKKTAKD
jgi:prefoldin alpha subunit